MKLLPILLLISLVGRGQSKDSAERYCIINTDSFLIKYKFTGTIFEPAVARFKTINGVTTEDLEAYINNRHYYSTISVYAIKNGESRLIGKEFPGVYIPAGCYEDSPEGDIKRAQIMQNEFNISHQTLYRTNIADPASAKVIHFNNGCDLGTVKHGKGWARKHKVKEKK